MIAAARYRMADSDLFNALINEMQLATAAFDLCVEKQRVQEKLHTQCAGPWPRNSRATGTRPQLHTAFGWPDKGIEKFATPDANRASKLVAPT